MIRVLSLGAGVQSTTVLLLSCRGDLPRLDAAVFADTQWEPKSVYKHLAWLEVEARCAGIPIHRVTVGDLRADGIQFRRSGGKACGDPGYRRRASIPCFVKNLDGSVGMIRRQCTSEYKIEPVEKFIRRSLLGLRPREVAPPEAVEHWFGISHDELSRKRISTQHWQTFRYPLITDVSSPKKDTLFPHGFDRQDCLDWLATHGYPRPPRSACIGCPYHSDAEWVRMKRDDPVSWNDAVAFDHDCRAADAALQAEGAKDSLAGRLVGLPYLHRSCVPLDQVEFRADDLAEARIYGMENECEGMCGV